MKLTLICLLVGSASLFIAPDLAWRSPGIIDSPIALHSLDQFLNFSDFSTWLAGAVGLFTCFWPGRHPARRVLIFVYLPAIGAISVLAGKLLFDGSGPISVLLSMAEEIVRRPIWVCSVIWKIGPRIHYEVIGLLLTFVYMTLVGWHSTDAPAILPDQGMTTVGDFSRTKWRRIRGYIWISMVVFFPFLILSRLVINSLELRYLLLLAEFARGLELLIPIVLLVWLIGPTWRRFWPHVLHVPSLRYWVSGAGLGVGVTSFLFLSNQNLV